MDKDDRIHLRLNVEGRLVEVLGARTASAHFDLLTEAEGRVARLAARGLTNAEIAARRGRSQKTVSNQLASIYKKLGVKSREQLVGLLSEASSE